MKRLAIFILGLMCGLGAMAQETTWENVTALTYAATGGKDKGHALQQYMLFDESIMEQNSGVFERYRTFTQEFSQISLNQSIPEGLAALDEQEKELKKMIKEHPELKEQFEEALKGAELAKKEFAAYEKPEVNSYSEDPAALLKDLTRLAVNKKAYTAWRDIGGGLYAVAVGRCYGPIEQDAFSRAAFEEGQEYSWGVIDATGREVIPMKHSRITNANEEHDIIFLHSKEKDGRIRAGACGYDGRVRIPFEYDEILNYNLEQQSVALTKNGKIGMLSFDARQLQPFVYEYASWQGDWLVRKEKNGPLGVVSAEGKLVIPLIYKCDWNYENGEMSLQRYDGKLDVYKLDSFEFLRTDPAPEM